jgi:hypothetical protein
MIGAEAKENYFLDIEPIPRDDDVNKFRRVSVGRKIQAAWLRRAYAAFFFTETPNRFIASGGAYNDRGICLLTPNPEYP